VNKYGFLLAVAISFVAFACADRSKECDAAFLDEDYDAAAKSCAEAAGQGDPSAQFTLGRMYDAGAGVSKDAVKAVEWLTLAAEQGNQDAPAHLGMIYARGREGVPKDNTRAYMWLTVATAAGHPLSGSFKSRVEASMSPEQLAKGYWLSREWLEKHKE
jgi:hypothetical protein